MAKGNLRERLRRYVTVVERRAFRRQSLAEIDAELSTLVDRLQARKAAGGQPVCSPGPIDAEILKALERARCLEATCGKD
jgi:hypothetical protein